MDVIDQIIAWWPVASPESKQTVYIFAGFIGVQIVMDLINRFLNPGLDHIQ